MVQDLPSKEHSPDNNTIPANSDITNTIHQSSKDLDIGLLDDVQLADRESSAQRNDPATETSLLALCDTYKRPSDDMISKSFANQLQLSELSVENKQLFSSLPSLVIGTYVNEFIDDLFVEAKKLLLDQTSEIVPQRHVVTPKYSSSYFNLDANCTNSLLNVDCEEQKTSDDLVSWLVNDIATINCQLNKFSKSPDKTIEKNTAGEQQSCPPIKDSMIGDNEVHEIEIVATTVTPKYLCLFNNSIGDNNNAQLKINGVSEKNVRTSEIINEPGDNSVDAKNIISEQSRKSAPSIQVGHSLIGTATYNHTANYSSEKKKRRGLQFVSLDDVMDTVVTENTISPSSSTTSLSDVRLSRAILDGNGRLSRTTSLDKDYRLSRTTSLDKDYHLSRTTSFDADDQSSVPYYLHRSFSSKSLNDSRQDDVENESYPAFYWYQQRKDCSEDSLIMGFADKFSENVITSAAEVLTESDSMVTVSSMSSLPILEFSQVQTITSGDPGDSVSLIIPTATRESSSSVELEKNVAESISPLDMHNEQQLVLTTKLTHCQLKSVSEANNNLDEENNIQASLLEGAIQNEVSNRVKVSLPNNSDRIDDYEAVGRDTTSLSEECDNFGESTEINDTRISRNEKVIDVKDDSVQTHIASTTRDGDLQNHAFLDVMQVGDKVTAISLLNEPSETINFRNEKTVNLIGAAPFDINTNSNGNVSFNKRSDDYTVEEPSSKKMTDSNNNSAEKGDILILQKFLTTAKTQPAIEISYTDPENKHLEGDKGCVVYPLHKPEDDNDHIRPMTETAVSDYDFDELSLDAATDETFAIETFTQHLVTEAVRQMHRVKQMKSQNSARPSLKIENSSEKNETFDASQNNDVNAALSPVRGVNEWRNRKASRRFQKLKKKMQEKLTPPASSIIDEALALEDAIWFTVTAGRSETEKNDDFNMGGSTSPPVTKSVHETAQQQPWTEPFESMIDIDSILPDLNNEVK